MSLMIFWTWAKVCHQTDLVSSSYSQTSQGLEDRFDGANRKNLRHFIHINNGPHDQYTLHPQAEVQFEGDSQEDNEKPDSVGTPTYYYLSHDAEIHHRKDPNSQAEVRRELARIPTCAVFHKIASGSGVPHTFMGFVRQWPALPRVVVCLKRRLQRSVSLTSAIPQIFLSVRVLPVARVSSEDRYVVDKVRSITG